MSIGCILRCGDAIIAFADKRRTFDTNGKLEFADDCNKLFVFPEAGVLMTWTGQVSFANSTVFAKDIVAGIKGKTSQEILAEIGVKILSYAPLTANVYIQTAELKYQYGYGGPCLIKSLTIDKDTKTDNGTVASISTNEYTSNGHRATGMMWAMRVIDYVHIDAYDADKGKSLVKSIMKAIVAVRDILPYEEQTISNSFDIAVLDRGGARIVGTETV